MGLFSRFKQMKQWQGGGGYAIDAVRAAADRLGNPQDRYRTVHITGTNGKGSTATLIAAGLGASGLKVGLFSSPHLFSINERFIIDGFPVSDEKLEQILSLIVESIGEDFFALSFFEACTLLGFTLFHVEKVDFGVIEVGLGGTLDATNIIHCPEVSVFTSISLDHENVLGPTEAHIARDKSGIIKAGSKVAIGAVTPDIRELIEAEASNRGARETAFVESGEGSVSRLSGEYQRLNAALARRTLRMLGIGEEKIDEGFSQAFWPGRLERVDDYARPILFECAHNIGGVKKSVESLRELNLSEPVIAFGALATKQWREMLLELVSFSNQFVLLEPDSDRALPVDQLKEFLSGMEINFKSYGRNYQNFVAEQVTESTDSRPLVIIGSIYLVGVIRGRLGLPFGPLWRKGR